jgi:AcrR family transcriptional regulator
MARIDREAVVDAAISLADDQGLDNVSLRRVAARLGVTPMALYRHVESKDALLDELTERLYEQLALPDPAAEWWDALAGLARSARTALLAHPWGALLFARPLAGPHSHAIDEAMRTALRSAGFSAAESRELHGQLSNMLFALIGPELHGKRNRAAFERGLELMHAGLESRLARRP